MNKKHNNKQTAKIDSDRLERIKLTKTARFANLIANGFDAVIHWQPFNIAPMRLGFTIADSVRVDDPMWEPWFKQTTRIKAMKEKARITKKAVKAALKMAKAEAKAKAKAAKQAAKETAKAAEAKAESIPPAEGGATQAA